MTFIETIGAATSGAIDAIASWQRNTNQCSAPSHDYLYLLLALWFVLSLAGVHFYRRMNRPMPKHKRV